MPAKPPGKPKNAGVVSLSLFQWIFPTQELNQGLRQNANSGIFRVMGWLHLGAPEQKDILPDITATERGAGGCVPCSLGTTAKRLYDFRHYKKRGIAILFAYVTVPSPKIELKQYGVK